MEHYNLISAPRRGILSVRLRCRLFFEEVDPLSERPTNTVGCYRHVAVEPPRRLSGVRTEPHRNGNRQIVGRHMECLVAIDRLVE